MAYEYGPEITDIHQPVEIPLSDGTVVKMTAVAAYGLGDAKLRVKRAGGYEYIVFRPDRHPDVPEKDFEAQSGTEVSLRDWLAFWVYHLAPSYDGSMFTEGRGKCWNGSVTLADGDPRNLMPSNFRLVWHETPFENSRLAPQADAACARASEKEKEEIAQVEAVTRVENGQTKEQLEYLNDSNLYQTALRQTKKGAESHAEDIVQSAYVVALETISSGRCEATTKAAVCKFFLAICENKVKEFSRLRKKEEKNKTTILDDFEDAVPHYVRRTAPKQTLEQF